MRRQGRRRVRRQLRRRGRLLETLPDALAERGAGWLAALDGDAAHEGQAPDGDLPRPRAGLGRHLVAALGEVSQDTDAVDADGRPGVDDHLDAAHDGVGVDDELTGPPGLPEVEDDRTQKATAVWLPSGCQTPRRSTELRNE